MSTNKMWGGRFESGPAAIMREITPSIDFDKRLAAEDLAGSRAHCRMLATEGIISKDDGQPFWTGLPLSRKKSPRANSSSSASWKTFISISKPGWPN
jgi:argininosuccinate lyase